jgi:integrase
MALTDKGIQAARGEAKPYKMADGQGLYLLVRPDGARYWRMDYRFMGKRKTLAFGVYPETSLAEARQQRDAARKLLKDDKDPSAQKKLDKLTATIAAENTFKVVAEEWLAKRVVEGKSEATLAKDRWLMEAFAYPTLGERPIGEIEPPELLATLRVAEKKGLYETARRLRSTCGRVFRYGIATGRATRDPAADLQGALIAPKVTHRAAILDPKGVGVLIRTIRGYDGKPTTRIALQLLALVFVRPVELRYAEWQEFDVEAALWRIPAARMKMRAPHTVPLSRQALGLLRELKELGGNGRFLLPSLRSPQRPISENTLNAALRRLDYGKDEMTGHGFRRIASTLLNEQGFNRDWIERQLAHQDDDEIRAAYNAAEYLAERTKMMQAWADYLDRLAVAEVKGVEGAGQRKTCERA